MGSARAVTLLVITGSLAAEVPVTSLLHEPSAFGAAVESRFGRDVRVLRIGIGPESAEIELQDRSAPSHVDSYAFEDGALGPAEPVQVGRSQRELNARLFPLAEVDLKILPRLLPDALERARTEEPRVMQLTIERVEGSGDYPTWSAPLIQVVVNGPRGGAVVRYRLDGKHKGTTRW